MADAIVQVGGSTIPVNVVAGLPGPEGPPGPGVTYTNVLSDFGSVADAKIIEFATMSAGSKTLTAGASVFAAEDVGKSIRVAGAGAGGAKLMTTIDAVTSPTQATLAAAAQTATSNKGASFGTDCGPALKAALVQIDQNGGGTLIIDGLHFLATPVSHTFSTFVAQVGITGFGSDSGLCVAVGAAQDALTLSGGARLLIEGVNLVGTPLELSDARRTLNITSLRTQMVNCAFFGLACIGQDGGAVIWAEGADLRMWDNFFGSSVGGLSNDTVHLENFAGFSSERDWFLDYGRFRGILFIKTGMSFTRSWIFGNNQFAEDSNAVGQSVFRVTDSRFDEGHVLAVALTTTLGSGKRIDRVEIAGMQVNNSLVSNGTAIYLERVDNAVIDQPAIGWRNTPGDGLTLIDCGNVHVRGANVTAGAPGAPTGMADGIVANGVQSLTLEDSNFRRFTFTNVQNFIQINDGHGAVSFAKRGRITDADFGGPQALGAIAVDVFNNKIYARCATGWLGAALTTQTDPTFALYNVNPATGTLTGSDTFAKSSGADSWTNTAASLDTTVTGSFRLRAKFVDTTAGKAVRMGATRASNGLTYQTGNNDFALGVLQDADSVFIISGGNIFGGPWPYTAGQEVSLEYTGSTGVAVFRVNGVIRFNGVVPNPGELSASLEHRFSSTLYSDGSKYQLLEYGPL